MSTIITHRQFPGYHKYEMELAGRPLTLEVGKLAELANAAVMVGYGDTRVLVCATASARPRDGPPRSRSLSSPSASTSSLSTCAPTPGQALQPWSAEDGR